MFKKILKWLLTHISQPVWDQTDMVTLSRKQLIEKYLSTRDIEWRWDNSLTEFQNLSELYCEVYEDSRGLLVQSLLTDDELIMIERRLKHV